MTLFAENTPWTMEEFTRIDAWRLAPVPLQWDVIATRLGRGKKSCQVKWAMHRKARREAGEEIAKKVNGWPWSDEDDAKLRDFAQNRTTTWDAITAVLPGRTKVACCTRLTLLKRLDANEKIRKGDLRGPMQLPLRPSELPQPRAFGDPPPGRSALDKMKAVSA